MFASWDVVLIIGLCSWQKLVNFLKSSMLLLGCAFCPYTVPFCIPWQDSSTLKLQTQSMEFPLDERNFPVETWKSNQWEFPHGLDQCTFKRALWTAVLFPTRWCGWRCSEVHKLFVGPQSNRTLFFFKFLYISFKFHILLQVDCRYQNRGGILYWIGFSLSHIPSKFFSLQHCMRLRSCNTMNTFDESHMKWHNYIDCREENC